MVTRFEEWPILLSRFLQERQSMPFLWGENDCMQFVSQAVERLTGHNFYEPYSGYDTEEGALAVLEENGGVHGIITACLGNGHKEILNAGRGDLVIFKMPEFTAGIVDDSGQKIACVTKNDGLLRLPLTKAIRVWSY